MLDMTTFNRLTVDERAGLMTVQSGATWHDIQQQLHPRFAVKAMQSTDIFSVAGSISVNAHGMDHRAGSVGQTVRAMRVMLADGSIRTVSRAQDERLFRLVVGGYGLFAVILDADLEITPNVVLSVGARDAQLSRVRARVDRPAPARPALRPDVWTPVHGAAIAPRRDVRLRLQDGGRTGAAIPPLGEVSRITLRRFIFNLSKRGALPMRLKWFAEKRVEPLLESCPVSRNEAMGQAEGCFVSRNDPMHDSVAYLRNNLAEETDILHEYFIPQDRFVPFVDGLRAIVRDTRANRLNASVRVVRREDNFLTYAPDDPMLAVVLYLNQSTDVAGRAHMASLTTRIIDLCLQNGGRFFLPYQIQYSADHLERSYPQIREFLAARAEFDPEGLLTSTFSEQLQSLLNTPSTAGGS